MNLFSISQLAQFSGIKPHTIRMWEQRYNALKPDRSEGNTRYYNNVQLRRLLNIVSLQQQSIKVSALCALSDKEIFKLLGDLPDNTVNDNAEGYFISQLIAAGMSYDEVHFEKTFSHCLLKYGMKEAYTKVIYPMLIRLGLLWTKDSIPPAQEHFISNLLRQKLFTAIDALPPAKPGSDCWLLYLPENEFHEIGLLHASYLIRLSGSKAIYMGANLPVDSLNEAVDQLSPEHLLLFLVHNNLPRDTEDYLNEIARRFRSKKIFVACQHKILTQVKTPKNVQWLASVADLEQQLVRNSVIN